MKSKTTIRRWIKELKPFREDRELCVFADGMITALNCVMQKDWPTPLLFMKVARGAKDLAK